MPAPSDPFPTRTFAWDSVSFALPGDWDLAVQRAQRRVTRVEFEDRYALRMEAEWMRPRRELELQRIRRRYDHAAKRLMRHAREADPIDRMPDGWVATLFQFSDDQRLLTAIHLAEGSSLFAFFLIRFDEHDEEDPAALIRSIAESFRTHDGPIVPWRTYDIGLDLPCEFRLRHALFETGIKHLQFTWRRRRLYLWYLPLANMILREVSLEEWAPEFLNARRPIRGLRFRPGVAGGIDVRKRTIHSLGGMDEIVRLCYLYEARCHHLKERNQIAVSLLHYRWMSDVDMLDRIDLDAPAL